MDLSTKGFINIFSLTEQWIKIAGTFRPIMFVDRNYSCPIKILKSFL